MTSLTKRLVGKGTRQDMEYKEELVHNALLIAQNTIVLVAQKVEDNVLHVITAPVVAAHSLLHCKTLWPTHHAALLNLT